MKLQSATSEREQEMGSGLLDEGLLSCVMCGILSFVCVAVVQPSKAAARYIMSNNNCRLFNDRSVSSEESSDVDDMSSWEEINHDSTPISGCYSVLLYLSTLLDSSLVWMFRLIKPFIYYWPVNNEIFSRGKEKNHRVVWLELLNNTLEY